MTTNNQYCYCFCLISKLLVPKDYFTSRFSEFKQINENLNIKSVLYISFNNYIVSTFYCLEKKPLEDLIQKLKKDNDHKIFLLSSTLNITFLPNFSELDYFSFKELRNEEIFNKTIELCIHTLEKLENNPSEFIEFEKYEDLLNKLSYVEQKTDEVYTKVFLGNGNSINSQLSSLGTTTVELRRDIDSIDEAQKSYYKKLAGKLDKDQFDLIYLLGQTDLKTLASIFLIVLTVSVIAVDITTPVVKEYISKFIQSFPSKELVIEEDFN